MLIATFTAAGLALWYAFMALVLYVQFTMVVDWYRWWLLCIAVGHGLAVVAVMRIGVHIANGCIPSMNNIGEGTLVTAQAFLLIWQVGVCIRDMIHVGFRAPLPQDFMPGGIAPPKHFHLEVLQLCFQLAAVVVGVVLVFRACPLQ